MLRSVHYATDNTLIIVIICAVILLVVIAAYRKRIKAGIKDAELSIEAEGRSEAVSSAPPTIPTASQPTALTGRPVTASGVGAAAIGGKGKGATIVTGSGNTVHGRRRKR